MIDSMTWNVLEEEAISSQTIHPDRRSPQHEILSMSEATDHPPRFLLRGGGNETQQFLLLPEHSSSSPPPIFISQSCLLLPVFLAAWWYYTKQCLRKVTGFLRNQPEPTEGSERFRDKFFRFDDPYIQWYVCSLLQGFLWKMTAL